MAKKKNTRNTQKGIASLVELSDLAEPDRILTDISPIDIYTSGGIPLGGMTLLSGVEGSGKSTTAARIVAGHQRATDKKCLYIDAENKIDPLWATMHGVDKTRVMVCKPNSGEEAQDVSISLGVENLNIGIVVIDSIAALCSQREFEAEPGQAIMGGSAQLITSFIRRLTSLQLKRVREGNPLTVILVNQERETLSLFSSIILPGGRQQRYLASTWIRFLKSDYTKIKVNDIEIYPTTTLRFLFAKNMGSANKMSGEFEVCTMAHAGRRTGQILDGQFLFRWAKVLGVITKEKDKFTWQDQIHKEENWIEAIQSNVDLKRKLTPHVAKAYAEIMQDSGVQEYEEEDDEETLAES